MNFVTTFGGRILFSMLALLSSQKSLVCAFSAIPTYHFKRTGLLGCRQSQQPHILLEAKKKQEDEMQSNDGKNGEKKSGNTDIDGEDNWIATEISEVIANEGLDREVEDEEWLPDKEKARRKREQARQYQSAVSTGDRDIDAKRQQESIGNANDAASGADTDTYPSGERGKKSSAYTEEEEEIIRSMGGTRKKASKREQGYLGDSTLQEIAADYQVPVCYLADVLCMWGVPIPINTSDRLGDLVTGEVRPGSSSIFMFCTRRNLTSYSTIVFFQNQTP